MDNQQGSLISWLAGIIDGEGWVGLNRRYGKHRIGFRPAIQISNRDIRILKRCEEIVKKYYNINVYWGKHIPVVHKQGTPHIWLVGLKIYQLLKDLLPLMMSKCNEAEVLIEYIEYKINAQQDSKRQRWQKIDIIKEEEFYNKLRQQREIRPLRDYTLNIL